MGIDTLLQRETNLRRVPFAVLFNRDTAISWSSLQNDASQSCRRQPAYLSSSAPSFRQKMRAASLGGQFLFSVS